MKKTGIVIAALIAANFCHGQEKFIEVVVKDTILVEPVYWIYHVTVEADGNDAAALVDSLAKQFKAKTSTKNEKLSPTTFSINNYENNIKAAEKRIPLVKKLAVENGGTDIENLPAFNDFSVKTIERKSYEKAGVDFSFKSRESMSKFTTALAALKNVNGYVVSAVGPEPQTYLQTIYRKLYAAAEAKASLLAAMTGKKAGAAIQVSEETDRNKSSLENLMESLFAAERANSNGGFNGLTTIGFRHDKIKVEKTLTVRFILE
jgi:hypothetical protein